MKKTVIIVVVVDDGHEEDSEDDNEEDDKEDDEEDQVRCLWRRGWRGFPHSRRSRLLQQGHHFHRLYHFHHFPRN